MVRKIAVLGGGMGSLSALMSLTENPADRPNLDITVYQLGWRLGGKCASGRDVSEPPAGRIYEHGLHIFAGFYFHSFGMLKTCYDELAGSGGVVAADVYDAFQRKNDVVLYERVNGQQVQWPLSFLDMPGLPHQPPAVPTLSELIASVLEALFSHYLFGEGHPETLQHRAPLSAVDELPGEIADRVRRVVERAGDDAYHFVDRLVDREAIKAKAEDYSPAAPPLTAPSIHYALLLGHDVARRPDASPYEHLEHVRTLLESFESEVRLFSAFSTPNWLRRLLLGINLGHAVLSGIEGDDVAANGFDPLDGVELKDWLRQWGAREETVNWAPVDAGYDYAFAYGEGDEARPSLGAGTGLRGFMRLLFAYKGSLFWEMKGAMGEIVVLPIYQVLKQRGVKFEFFHEVKNLALSADGTRIERIEMMRQAQPAPAPYDPLIDFGTLKAWPHEPKWGALQNGAAMQAAGVDFESPWSPNPFAQARNLQHGVDFDEVILGISVAEVKRITPELQAHSPAWTAMVNAIKGSRTIALQLWTKYRVGAGGGGFGYPNRVCTRTRQPLSTWSDMSFLIASEGWPAAAKPNAIYYFCGQVAGAEGPQNFGDPTVPALAKAKAVAACKTWLKNNASGVMPAEARPAEAIGLDPNHLFVADGSVGNARFDWQYTRVNISPTELYVQSAPGTLQHRLRADQSGFANLYLAGDWTLNGLNAGCVEAAVMSGIQCANALRGIAGPIPGEQDTV